MKMAYSLAIAIILISLILFFTSRMHVNTSKNESVNLNTGYVLQNTNKVSLNTNKFKNENYTNLKVPLSKNELIKTSGFTNQLFSNENCTNIKIFPFPFLINIDKDAIKIYTLQRYTAEQGVYTKLDNPIEISLSNPLQKCIAEQDEFENTTITLSTNNSSITINTAKGLPFMRVESSKILILKNDGDLLGIKNINEKSLNIYIKPLIKNVNDIPTNYPKITYEFVKNENNYYQQININPSSPFVLLPHHQQNLYNTSNSEHSSIFKSIKGDVYSIYTNKVEINLGTETFQDLYKTSENNNKELANYLKEDIDTLGKEAFSDNLTSYWNGKKLFKVANLLVISNYLNNKEYTSNLIKILKNELSDYFTYSGDTDKKYFIYYKNIGALQNSKPDFGHENLNDTHFHFAYYIYAASVLCKFDSEFCNKNKDVIEALINSVASFNKNDYFPYLRHLSLYEGHSFASGLTKSGDGNNQESSSESINFWYSSYLFKNQINSSNKDLYLAGYLLESLTAKTYYLNYYSSALFDKEYKHKIFSIVWEGKNDFATWFSGNPKAIYGIQFIPLSFGSVYLKNENYKNILNDLSNEEKNYNKTENIFDDLILGYKIINEKTDKSLIEKLPDIDSSNSKSWMLYLNSTLVR